VVECLDGQKDFCGEGVERKGNEGGGGIVMKAVGGACGKTTSDAGTVTRLSLGLSECRWS
jgi:hypothetical protein